MKNSSERKERRGDVTPEPVLRVEGLKVVANSGRNILDGVSFSIRRGEVFGLLGESSAGKTTLAKTVLRVLPQELRLADGRIFIKGADITHLPEKRLQEFWGRKMSYLPQNAGAALNPVFRLRSQLEEIARTRTRDKKEQWALIERALRQVQLPTDAKFLRQFPFQLSGGQQQRFLLAELLIANPALLIADEPTSALDMPLQQEMIGLLEEIRQRFKMAILFISHDLAIVEKIADRIGILFEGRLVEVEETETLIAEPRHWYTRQLVHLHRAFAL